MKTENQPNAAGPSPDTHAKQETQESAYALIDAEIYNRGLIVSAFGPRGQRGFRVLGRYYYYFHDANEAARNYVKSQARALLATLNA